MATSNPTSWSLPTEKIITPDQVHSILAEAKRRSERDYVFFLTTANTGLRLCEVAHLMRDDVLEKQLIVMRRKKKQLRAEFIDVAPKAHKIIKAWADRFELGYLFPGRCGQCIIKRRNGIMEQVCIGGHVSLRDIQRHWELTLKAVDLKVPGRGIHSTRHFAITQFYDKHRDLRAAQLFAGHSSSQITERYASVREMRAKVEAMDAMV